MSNHLNKKYRSSINNGEIYANQNACTTDKDNCCGEYDVQVVGNDIVVTDAGGYSFTLVGAAAAGSDNIFTASLTADANRIHTLTGYTMTFNSGANPLLILDDTFSKLAFGTSGVQVNADGINLVFEAGDDLRLANQPGNADEYLASQGADNAPIWKAKKYVDTFVIADFTANDLVITAATHGMGTDPIVQVSTGTGPYTVISNETEVISVAANGDITITDAGGGFDGKVVIV